MKLVLVMALALMAFITGVSLGPTWDYARATLYADSPAIHDVHGQAKLGHQTAPDPRVKYYRGAFDACRLFAQGMGDDEMTATFNCLGFVKQLSEASYYEASELKSGTP